MSCFRKHDEFSYSSGSQTSQILYNSGEFKTEFKSLGTVVRFYLEYKELSIRMTYVVVVFIIVNKNW